jgi:hypothetical protein
MTLPVTIECTLPLHVRNPGRRRAPGNGVVVSSTPPDAGRVPRIARLLALAHRLEHLLRTGQVADYATLARLGHVTRPRISQIMNLLLLAPDIQEHILFLPPTRHGRDPIHLAQLQPIAATLDWRQQRRLWAALAGHPAPPCSPQTFCKKPPPSP